MKGGKKVLEVIGWIVVALVATTIVLFLIGWLISMLAHVSTIRHLLEAQEKDRRADREMDAFIGGLAKGPENERKP